MRFFSDSRDSRETPDNPDDPDKNPAAEPTAGWPDLTSADAADRPDEADRDLNNANRGPDGGTDASAERTQRVPVGTDVAEPKPDVTGPVDAEHGDFERVEQPPQEQETAFHAGTVGGAVAASAAAAGAVYRPDADVDPVREDATASAADDRLDGDEPVDRDEFDEPDPAGPGPVATGVASVPDGTDSAAAGVPGDHTVEEPGPERVGDPSAPPDSAVAGTAAAVVVAEGLWSDGAADGFRARWREVQLRFVDDPNGAAGAAKALVAEAVDGLTAALGDHRDRLNDWESTPGDETERLRVAVRGYRGFLDRLLDL
jgi:hypothetical protein